MDGFVEAVLNAVKLLNRITVTGILVTAFSLVVYIGLYNRRSDIARNFAFVLACVIGTFLSDLLTQVSTETDLWLRLQWIGISLIPAVSLHLSDALLRATGNNEPVRRFATKLLYGVGLVFIVLSMFTDLIATSGLGTNSLPHLEPGPGFFVFALYYFPTAIWATYNVIVARRRALTATSKRRMTYLAAAFAAPALGMFPYLLPIGWPAYIPQLVAWTTILVVNTAVGTAITFMGYTVAYFGASAPDRVIKRRWVKWILRGPVPAALVITAFVVGSRVDRWLGLPGDFIGFIASATIILLHQLFIITLQPSIDRIIAGEDASEVRRLQQFSDRLMTTSDRVQYLEGILVALCDLLRARNGFITMRPVPGNAGAPIDPLTVIVGSTTSTVANAGGTNSSMTSAANTATDTPANSSANPSAMPDEAPKDESAVEFPAGSNGGPATNGTRAANAHIELPVPQAAVQSAMALRRNGKSTPAENGRAYVDGVMTAALERSDEDTPTNEAQSAQSTPSGQSGQSGQSAANGKAIFELENDFITWQGYWLIPLRANESDDVLGVMGLEARAPDGAELNDEEREGIAQLVSQAALLLEDAIKQQRAFEALMRIMPDAENMQRRMAEISNPAAPTMADFSVLLPVENYDDFTHLVRDALSQYWGGPKLVDSPLVNLRIVAEAMAQENGNATKALRNVLSRAIERLKPDGQRSTTAAEWMLYNILELKIIQSMKVRDVARKLVMSESDLYRKQRAAFEEVARQMIEMEKEARASATANTSSAE